MPSTPAIETPSIKVELAERQQAISAGGLSVIMQLIEAIGLRKHINRSRQIVWKQQPAAFFERAIIEADGTMVETSGQRKEGIGMNYKPPSPAGWAMETAGPIGPKNLRT